MVCQPVGAIDRRGQDVNIPGVATRVDSEPYRENDSPLISLRGRGDYRLPTLSMLVKSCPALDLFAPSVLANTSLKVAAVSAGLAQERERQLQLRIK